MDRGRVGVAGRVERPDFEVVLLRFRFALTFTFAGLAQALWSRMHSNVAPASGEENANFTFSFFFLVLIVFAGPLPLIVSGAVVSGGISAGSRAN